MRTNRDFYLAIADLAARAKEEGRTLEEYLRVLLGLADAYRGRGSLRLQEFFEILSHALTALPLAYDGSWVDTEAPAAEQTHDFESWRRLVVLQITDLREMAASGQLDGEFIYFGIDAPRGSRWYNFDVGTYLECAAAGSLGGWQEGDATGRIPLPGPVAVLEPDGSIGSRDTGDRDDPIFEIPAVDWAMFADFLECGQYYE